jgi:simple sugar transport system substrate-binding protein
MNSCAAKKCGLAAGRGRRIMLIAIAALLLGVMPGCRAKQAPAGSSVTGNFSVLVYITGVTAGSPSYEMMAEGALEFAGEHGNVTVRVYEAGFNQAEWEEQLTSLVADGGYDLVLGSNPSLPEICANVGKQFPEQKFAITDSYYEGNPRISTWLYNQYEQSLYLGYLAGLVTTSGMPRANSAKKIGFIAAQEYPLLTRHMVPGFLEGARRVDPEITLDFRVIGNWYDANKAADLASGMIDSGVDVFTSIAGGAAQGLIRTIREKARTRFSTTPTSTRRRPASLSAAESWSRKNSSGRFLMTLFRENSATDRRALWARRTAISILLMRTRGIAITCPKAYGNNSTLL